uniref:Uncharacterized protein n=2 Tax=Meloidogyne TaxID=189290 RepID=A0A915MTQ1_MELJA
MNLKLLFYCLSLILFLISCVDGMPLRRFGSLRRRSTITPENSSEPERNTASNTNPLPEHMSEEDENDIVFNFDNQHEYSPNTNRRGDMGAADNGNIPGQILITTDGQNDIVYNFGMQHGNNPNTNRRHKNSKNIRKYVPYRDEASKNLFEHRRNFKQTREEEAVEAPTPFSNSEGSEHEEDQSSLNSSDHNSNYGDNKEPSLYNDAEIYHTGGSGYHNHEAGSSSNTFGSSDHDHIDYGFEGNELVYNLQNMHLRQGGGIQHNTRANQPDMHGPISNSSRNKHRVKKHSRNNH